MTMTQQIDEILKRVNEMLDKGASRGIDLKIANHKLDDDWLYIVVVPSSQGQRASEHANYMSEIERNLKNMGYSKVLLVPALDE